MFQGLAELVAKIVAEPEPLLLVGIDQQHPHVLHFKGELERKSAARRFREKVLQAINVYRWYGREYKEEVSLDETEKIVNFWLSKEPLCEYH